MINPFVNTISVFDHLTLTVIAGSDEQQEQGRSKDFNTLILEIEQRKQYSSASFTMFIKHVETESLVDIVASLDSQLQSLAFSYQILIW